MMGNAYKKQSIPAQLKYTLGEACRTPIDMIINRSNKKAIQSAALLKKWDQVFIKRSNGLWTVAVMIDRALQPAAPREEESSSSQLLSKKKNKRHSRRSAEPRNNHPTHKSSHWCTVWEIDPTLMELDECMLFAIDGDGATKIINRKSLGKYEYVRRIKA